MPRPDAAGDAPSADADAADAVAAAGGDEAAFARLVDAWLPRLHSIAIRALGVRAEAEDVVQDTLLRAWRALPEWRPGAARFSTWLRRICLNLVNDRLRARRDQVPLDAFELIAPGADPERGAGQAQQARRVHAALRGLPERQRDAMLLCHFEGLGNIEAAATLEISVEALESLLGRARRRLRELLIDP